MATVCPRTPVYILASLGEVALQPATGGIFVVEIYYADTSTATQSDPDPNPTIQRRVLWDRREEGGFPETKQLKRRVRDIIEPDRNLGHVDRDYPKQQQPQEDKGTGQPNTPGKDARPMSNSNSSSIRDGPQVHGGRS